MFKHFLDVIFPPRCKICRRPCTDPICADCLNSFIVIKDNICGRCGKPCQRNVDECRDCSGKKFYFSFARSGGSYSGTLKKAIHQLKYRNGKRIAPYLAKFISNRLPDFVSDQDLIAFVPMTKYKEAKRGYNQSKLIAEELAKIYDKPLYNGLTKIKSIPEQNKLGLSERSRNVKGAFKATIPVSGKVVLVDDVYTTGSTANECALALKQNGASEIFVITVARTPLVGK